MTKLMMLGLISAGLILAGTTAEAKHSKAAVAKRGKAVTKRLRRRVRRGKGHAVGKRVRRFFKRASGRLVTGKQRAGSRTSLRSSKSLPTIGSFLDSGECAKDCGEANSSCAGKGNVCSRECRTCLAEITRGVSVLPTK